jgi:hypothetical protein
MRRATQIPHPYERLHATWQEEADNGKKRRQWLHSLEHLVFTREELYVTRIQASFFQRR